MKICSEARPRRALVVDVVPRAGSIQQTVGPRQVTSTAQERATSDFRSHNCNNTMSSYYNNGDAPSWEALDQDGLDDVLDTSEVRWYITS